MRKIIVAVWAAASLMATSSWAGFINGGFEDGAFTGWTVGGTSVSDSAVVTTGTDPNANNLLARVSNGTYAARVGNQAGNNHTSFISQTVTNWQDVKIWFAWAALLQEPTNGVYHSATEMADYQVRLDDLTTNTNLYNQAYNVSNIPAGGWNTGATNSVAGSSGLWHYSDWYAQFLDTSAVIGHDLKLTFTATDCSLGGHGGYMYVDQVGSQAPDLPSVPEPSTLLLLGGGLSGLFFYSRRRR